MFNNIKKDLSSELIKIRRDLHMIPELENNEFKTISYIKCTLDEIGIEYYSVLDTGLVAVINGKKGPGKTVLIRADIDALPIMENNDLPYKSIHSGIMHACGHDAHIACSLGVCKLLKEIDYNFYGCVKVVFQPAEEGSGGAERMINEGIMNNPSVDAAIALHVEPLCEVGTIQFRNGTIMACPDDFEITIKGIGGHGASPDTCNNPIYTASELSVKLKDIVNENFDDINLCVVSVCTINAGTSNNIIPDSVKITGTARSLDNDTRNKIEKLIDEYTKSVCEKYDCQYFYVYNRRYPPVINNTSINDIVCKSAKSLGYKTIELQKSSMTGDDFSYFSNLVPSSYFKLGAGNNSICRPLHSPDFNIDEECLFAGASILTLTSLNFLEDI